MRRNVIIAILAAIAVGVLYFFFVFSPQTEKIDAAKADVQAAQDNVQRLRLELSRLQALQQDAPRLREEAAKLDAAVPNDPQLAAFILQVQEAANASGIEWLSVTPAPPAAANPAQQGVQEVNVSMSVEGGYFQVQDFLVRIENLTRAVKVGTVSLASQGEGTGSPTLSASLTMKMFVSSTPAAPTTTAPAA